MDSEENINILRYIRSMKHEEDYEEFMENILNKNNTAHLESYKGIRNIIFGRRSKPIVSATSDVNTNQRSQKSTPNNVKSPSVNTKKGRTKFHDINKYQVKKKQKEGNI